jgi:hypothetical protein
VSGQRDWKLTGVVVAIRRSRPVFCPVAVSSCSSAKKRKEKKRKEKKEKLPLAYLERKILKVLPTRSLSKTKTI